MNKAILLGNLTKDVLTRQAGNKTVACFSIAVNEGKDNEGKDKVTFFNCEAWNKTGEIIAQHFSKGSKILVEGKIVLDKWVDRETGADRERTKITVFGFDFCESRNQSKSSDSDERPPQEPSMRELQAESEGNIPF